MVKIFNNLNIKFEGGKQYAIVGRSGSGKSTLIKLLYRLIDPNFGLIKIDGQNLK